MQMQPLEQCLDFAEYTMHSSRVPVSGSHIIDWAVSCVIKDKARQSQTKPRTATPWWQIPINTLVTVCCLRGLCKQSHQRRRASVLQTHRWPDLLPSGPICCLVAHRASKKCMLVARRLKIAVGPAGQWPMSCPVLLHFYCTVAHNNL